MNFLRSLFFLCLSLIPLAAAVNGSLLVGSWKPIKDVADKHVVDIGQYAVSEFNKQGNDDLSYERVVSGETKVVAGTMYKLVVAAKDDKPLQSLNYEAIVLEKPWMKYKNLTSFKPIEH